LKRKEGLAWGFPSPDSDYDVRFIYAHDQDWYLTILDKPDSMNFAINDQLDIGGWELKKFLILMKKSNASVIEWLQTPIYYQADPVFRVGADSMMRYFYQPIPTYYHYANMAKKFVGDLDNGMISVKNYLHALRALLAAKWTVTFPDPPMTSFELLVQSLIADKSLKTEIDLLLEKKRSGMKDHKRISPLDEFMAASMAADEEKSKELKSSKADVDKLDEFFKMTISKK